MSDSNLPRHSTSSDAEPDSPLFDGGDSTTALILVHDSEDNSNAPFNFSSDDDEDFHTQLDIHRASNPSLSPLTVFMFLLLPYLKLGALLQPNSGLSPKFAIPALLFFGLLSLFTRQVWCKLSRYTRKSELEDVVLETLARGRNKERRRQILRTAIRLSTGISRILLARIYLRGMKIPFILQ